MQQAKTKGNSAAGIGRKPSLSDFIANRVTQFGFANRNDDGSEVKFYSVNSGSTTSDMLGELACIVDVIEALARSIAERAEGDDEVTAQLAWAVLRFAEQASALTLSAVTAEVVQS